MRLLQRLALILLTLSVAALPSVSSAQTSKKSMLVVYPDLYALVEKSGFVGDVAINRADQTLFVPIPLDNPNHLPLWRWASVTKQVIAVLIMQEAAKGRIDIDAPISLYLPKFQSANAGKISVRQLLRHQTGLPNPDDVQASSMDASAYYFPSYRGNRDPLSGYCAGKPKGEPGGKWEYNNCDYMVAGALLEAVTGQSWQKLVQERIAKPLKLKSLKAFPTNAKTNKGIVGKSSEPPFDLATFGAAGALYGDAMDLVSFDRALMTGKLLPAAQQREMWDGQSDLGFIALGQWVFDANLKGCAKPVKIVERRGAIGGVQVRNFILPENDAVVVAFSNNGNFEFGEIWQGAGFSHDLLSLAVCS
jgi:D-alanyl-D-alanine carboxypeptidase